ncbi:MAG: glutathione S-transferase family protein [Aestuariivita sp.]|nr:glutathione S-transferase family protein [Aestuariivita sp.]
MLKLYDYELSGNCYKIRLMLSFLDVVHSIESVDFYPGAQHKSPAFLRLNPMGQLPVIEDAGMVLRDAQAILIYLAARYDSQGVWFPRDDPVRLGQIAQWLAFADSITATASVARLHDGLLYSHVDSEAARLGAHKLFRILDEHLYFCEQVEQTWICPGDQPTLADIACFPYVMLSEEGGISRIDYPALRRWCDRFKRIPGFVVMPGIFHAGPGLEASTV